VIALFNEVVQGRIGRQRFPVHHPLVPLLFRTEKRRPNALGFDWFPLPDRAT
jgi:hypothetical protein